MAPIPEREKTAEIEAHRRELAATPDDILSRFTLGNSLRMNGLLVEARAEYEIVAASGDNHWAVTSRQLLKEADEHGWRDAGPGIVWRSIWHWGFAPLTIERR